MAQQRSATARFALRFSTVWANSGQGIRYHRADSQEDQDVILAFGEHRRPLSTLATQLGYDYKAKRSISTSVPTAQVAEQSRFRRGDQAPGVLELLPTRDYNDGKPWLKVREKKVGEKKDVSECLALPISGDPYTEIYTSPAWYALVPDANLGLMTPGGGSQVEVIGSGKDDPRDKLDDVVRRVKSFHESIHRKYKTPTYAHYGVQGERRG